MQTLLPGDDSWHLTRNLEELDGDNVLCYEQSGPCDGDFDAYDTAVVFLTWIEKAVVDAESLNYSHDGGDDKHDEASDHKVALLASLVDVACGEAH